MNPEKEDDITRSLALLGIDNIRMKADIIQLQDELRRQRENWATVCALNIRIEQQNAAQKDFRKMLTWNIIFSIFALSVALIAII